MRSLESNPDKPWIILLKREKVAENANADQI
jgi:hypothetical protein